MKYLHTMVRVADLDASIDFYCNKLGLKKSPALKTPSAGSPWFFCVHPGMPMPPVRTGPPPSS